MQNHQVRLESFLLGLSQLFKHETSVSSTSHQDSVAVSAVMCLDVCKRLKCFRSEGELALGLFVTTSRVAGLDKMSPDWQGGYYLLVLGADNS